MLSTWALLMIAVVTEIAWGCSLKALFSRQDSRMPSGQHSELLAF